MIDKSAANESMLEIAVNATAAGHDLTGFEVVQDGDGNHTGYQAACRKCGKTVWCSTSGLQYSLLDDAGACSEDDRTTS